MNNVPTFWQPQMKRFAHGSSLGITLFLATFDFNFFRTELLFHPMRFHWKFHLMVSLVPNINKLWSNAPNAPNRCSPDLTKMPNVSHQNDQSGHKSFPESRAPHCQTEDHKKKWWWFFIILNNLWGPHLALDNLFTMKHSLVHKQTSFLSQFSPFVVSRLFLFGFTPLKCEDEKKNTQLFHWFSQHCGNCSLCSLCESFFIFTTIVCTLCLSLALFFF